MPISTQLTASLGALHVTQPHVQALQSRDKIFAILSMPHLHPGQQRTHDSKEQLLHARPRHLRAIQPPPQGATSGEEAAAYTSQRCGQPQRQRQQPVKCCHLPVSTASSFGKQGGPRRFHLNNWTVNAAGLYCSSTCPIRAGYPRRASALSGRAIIATRGASNGLRPLRGHLGLLWGVWAGCRPRPGCTPERL